MSIKGNCNNDVIRCIPCNKVYKDNSGLWKHNKNKHGNVPQNLLKNPQISSILPQKSSILPQNKIICEYCNKGYSRQDNYKRHLLKCKIKIQKIAEEKNNKLEIEKLKKDFEKLKKTRTNKIINIQNNNCNNDNRKLTICKPGNEDINSLTNTEKQLIKAQELNSILSLVDHLNFNDRLPHYQNFYVSAINDKYVNTIDEKTNNVIKRLKNELFDEILHSHMKKLEIMSQGDKKFQIILTKLKDIIYIRNGRKEFIKQINMLSYNKRDMVIKSWYKLIEDDNITIEAFSTKIEEDIKQLTTDEINQLTETNSDDESSSEDTRILIPSKIKKLYIDDESSSSE